ncbi:hypothetical protein DUI87_26404 [Hirundo rustica rustica]|uniref:Reverse transcriptase thumb domain-containing protein n=1 Tax=Hirundo rustica rustica TaxID=333673 RepID=A0A3M0JA45_HIRRU|nr:hypothetical protein DUI87_26404 [Hirundo rustica rustica]
MTAETERQTLLSESQEFIGAPVRDLLTSSFSHHVKEAEKCVLSRNNLIDMKMFLRDIPIPVYLKYPSNAEESYMRQGLSNTWLWLTESLLLNDDNWHFVAVDPSKPGTWPRIEGKFIMWDSTEKAINHHNMDDVLVCAPNDDVLTHALDLTISALIVAGFELQETKVQRMTPWRYLGLKIGKQTILPHKLAIRTKVRTLADVHQQCGALNWVRPWLGLATQDLASLFELLKGGEELSYPRVLTLEAEKALEKVQNSMSMRQAHQYEPDLPFKFIIMGKLPHLHGVIFQWDPTAKKDHGRGDPLLIIEWVILSHQLPKRMTRPQKLVAELIRKARIRIREMARCDFECIHIPIGFKSGQITKAMLKHLLQENEDLQFALDSFTVNHATIPSVPEEDRELEEGLDIEEQDHEDWPTQQECFAKSCPGPEHLPPPAQVSAF